MEKLKVLIVDNTAFVRELIKNNLRSHFSGLSVHDVDCARKAQSLLRMHSIDLLLCDWEMTDISGEQLLLWLRNLEGSANRLAPVVMLSSSIDKEHLVKAIDLGVSEYLTKPFTPEQLLSKLSKVLSKQGKLEQARGFSAVGQAMHSGLAAESLLALTRTKPPLDKAKLPASPSQKPQRTLKAAKPVPLKVQAQLQMGDELYPCDVKAITLNELKGQIERRAVLPQLFAPVMAKIQSKSGAEIAEVSAYIHALQSLDLIASSEQLLLTLRFSDSDPLKMEQLSKFISSL